MSKNLRQLREKAATKGPSVKLKELIPPADNTVATQRFIKKHVVAHHEDPAGNGDDVYNASNIKPVKRSPEHGYDPGQDEEVYESASPRKSEPHPIYHVLETAQKSARQFSGGQVLLHHKKGGKVEQYTIVDNHPTRGVSVNPLHRTRNDNIIGGYPVISHAKIGEMLNSGASLHVTHYPELTAEEEEEDFHLHPSQELITPLSNKGQILTRETRTGETKPIKPTNAITNRIGMYLNVPESYEPEGNLVESAPEDINNYWKTRTTSPRVLEKARLAVERASTRAAQPPPISFAGNYQGLLDHQRSQGAADLTLKIKERRKAEKEAERKKGFVGTILRTLGLSKESEQTLTNLYNTLNEENREKMIKLLESEEGFIKLIEFAVEKGID